MTDELKIYNFINQIFRSSIIVKKKKKFYLKKFNKYKIYFEKYLVNLYFLISIVFIHLAALLTLRVLAPNL